MPCNCCEIMDNVFGEEDAKEISVAMERRLIK